jgi:hypothetical protein
MKALSFSWLLVSQAGEVAVGAEKSILHHIIDIIYWNPVGHETPDPVHDFVHVSCSAGISQLDSENNPDASQALELACDADL